MDLVFKAALGAAVVLLLAVLAKTKNYYIAGLVPLFPTFALIAHYIVGSQRSGADLQKTALFGLWSLFPYAGYLVAVYFGSVRWPLAVTLGVATAVWVLMALAMIVLWARLHPAAAGA